VCQRFLLAHSVPAAWGEPARPGFPPAGETGKGRSNFLAAAGSSRWRSANAGHAGAFLCARSSSMFLSIPITNRYVDPLVPLSRSFAAPPTPLPCFYPHSKWAAIGPVQVGVRSQAQVPSPRVTDLGCWVLPSVERSLQDHRALRSHPNKAVDVVPTKLFRYLFACERSTYVGSCSHPPLHGYPAVGRIRFSSALAR